MQWVRLETTLASGDDTWLINQKLQSLNESKLASVWQNKKYQLFLWKAIFKSFPACNYIYLIKSQWESSLFSYLFLIAFAVDANSRLSPYLWGGGVKERKSGVKPTHCLVCPFHGNCRLVSLSYYIHHRRRAQRSLQPGRMNSRQIS